MINFIVGTLFGAFITVIIIGVCSIAAEDAVKDKEETGYHCNCTHCGKDWWTHDAFPSVCPFCHQKLI